MHLLASLTERLHALRDQLYRLDPEIEAALRDLEKFAPVQAPSDPGKYRDIRKYLDKVQPSHIVEIGSGRTSIIFAQWSVTHGARYEAFEQSSEWANAVNKACSRFDIRPVRQEKLNGIRFARNIPHTADFIYVDGPAVPGNYDTVAGKAQYRDVPDSLISGARPKCIMVDGRTDTVDAILETADNKYTFKGGHAWAAQRGHRHEIWAYRHSIFLRSS